MFHHDKRPQAAGTGAILAAWQRKRQLFAAALVDNIKASQCLLCLARGRRHCLCPDCLRDLPWLGRACTGCALPLPETAADHRAGHDNDEDRCQDCRLNAPPWQSVSALFRYEFPVDRLISAFKYHGRLALADAFGSLLADQLPPSWRPDLLLPVPLHEHRLRQRGYHQTALLAGVMARRLGSASDWRGLRRLRDTAMQKTLDPQARLANLSEAFAWQGGTLAGRHVMLVDDVMTTGATLRTLTLPLLAAGAASVRIAVIARTLPP